MCDMVRRGEQPPVHSSSAVQAILNRAASAPLSRSVLSKGIQHPSPLVQYTTLSTLLKVLQSLHTVQHDIQAAVEIASRQTDVQTEPVTEPNQAPLPQLFQAEQHHPVDLLSSTDQVSMGAYLRQYTEAGASVFEQMQQQQGLLLLDESDQSREASLLLQWQSFLEQLQQAFRARLPDPQSLLALLASLQKSKDGLTGHGHVSTAGKIVTAGTADSAGTAGKADAADMFGTAGTAGKADSAGAAGTADAAGTANAVGSADKADTAGIAVSKPSTASLPADSSASDTDSDSLDDTKQQQQALAAELQNGSESAQAMTATELTGTLLFMVLQKYQECLPEAMNDSRVDVPSLIPQVCAVVQ